MNHSDIYIFNKITTLITIASKTHNIKVKHGLPQLSFTELVYEI